MMSESILLVLIAAPAVLGILMLLIPRPVKYFWETFGVTIAACLIYLVISLWGREVNLNLAWLRIPGVLAAIRFQLRFYGFSQFILVAVAVFTFLIALYSAKFMTDRPAANQFYAYLFLSEAMAFGAVLANNLLIMLFFWEALLVTLYLMINIGHPKAYKTAIKALIIVGFSDLCLMMGIGIVGMSAHTLDMTRIHLSTNGINGIAFVLMMIGAMAKAGAMPFHTWIPDAALDAPLPFMALMPGALEKLLGIYLVARIALDLFIMDTGMQIFIMTVGAVTIIFAVMMALVQKDYKRLLSYHAISQVGYMVLGIGTGNPIGIAGGLFHMINNAMYKSCLFLTGGAVEKQAGTTDMRQLGGLARQMPVTFGCFLVAALSISGVPLTNGFVSKELILEGSLEAGYRIFAVAAAIGAVFTAASFLKLGHAVYFGKPSIAIKKVTEAHWSMLVPMILLAAGCLLFGLFSRLPLDGLIKPSLYSSLGHAVSEIHFDIDITQWLFWITMTILTIAVLNHIYGVKSSGSGLGASEHIHHAPGLKTVYDLAENRVFDPYVQGEKGGYYLVKGLYLVDRAVDWVYQSFFPTVAGWISETRKAHNGLFANYLSWVLGGFGIMIVYLFWLAK
jgi:NADH:ubiquinone oxidoreductase subunit 5 (subunit L)/multisubunit Na+/H+ antiporter MnhA subunit